ncbi:unannotated protein [freshwater metagenome]|uniref:Unannotated protein n=1 Tax=freshwater metagenome TaxID=449393 RepID=A0A6J6TYP9_9ZZZZ
MRMTGTPAIPCASLSACTQASREAPNAIRDASFAGSFKVETWTESARNGPAPLSPLRYAQTTLRGAASAVRPAAIRDIGIVPADGVPFGVVTCWTVFVLKSIPVVWVQGRGFAAVQRHSSESFVYSGDLKP